MTSEITPTKQCPVCHEVAVTGVTSLYEHFIDQHPDLIVTERPLYVVAGFVEFSDEFGRHKGVQLATFNVLSDGKIILRRQAFTGHHVDWVADHMRIAADQYHDRQPPPLTWRDRWVALRARWGL